MKAKVKENCLLFLLLLIIILRCSVCVARRGKREVAGKPEGLRTRERHTTLWKIIIKGIVQV